ncbi:inducible mutagenesis protein A [Roseibium aggregatum]|uniref:ImuA family protein n=1 Tax=Roseibium aggregatum TaxID=187304 RepID=UPI002E29263E|nr:inducible mutagenesis protein A [Roseibium aggregatum]
MPRSPENRRESRPENKTEIRPENRTDLAELRRRIAALEGGLPFNGQLGPAPAFAAVKQGPEPVRLSFGLDALDGLFAAGGLACGTLHEVVSGESRDAGALSGFALALLARVMTARSGAVLWVLDPLAGREAGLLHGPGLSRFGVDPARLIAVRPRRTEELLWAMEEGARSSVLAAVVGEVQGAQKALDLTATRRLLLRAQASGVPVFLVRHGAAFEPTAALTRWCVTPGRSQAPALLRAGPHEAIGEAAWIVDLTRNRDGRSGRLDLEWRHAERRFAAPARSVALVSGTGLRPDSAPDDGTVVAGPESTGQRIDFPAAG